MVSAGKHNDREVFLVDGHSLEWIDALNSDDFMLLIAGDDIKPATIEPLANRVLTKNPLFIHCCGNNSSQVEDCFHEEIVAAAVAYELSTGNEFDYDLSPPTAFDQQLENALWFSCIAAFNDRHEIRKIILVNFSPDKISKELVSEYLSRFAGGHFPV